METMQAKLAGEHVAGDCSSKLSDEQLVAGFISGEDSAFNILIARHQETLRRMLCSMTKDYDVANDLLQDGLIKAFEALKSGNYAEHNKFLPWLSTICRNLFKDYYRKHSKKQYATETIDERTFAAASDDTSEEAYEKEYRLLCLERCVAKLSSEQRSVVNRRLADMPFHQISREMNCSINTSLGRMRYAVLNLRAQMKTLVA